MKSLNGFLQVLDDRGISRSNLKILYDFAESGSVLNKAPNYSGLYTGVLTGTPTTFFHGSGTGYCASDLLSISSGEGIFSQNFTHIFSIQRSQTANDNLYSCLGESLLATSGYAISLNDAGKCVFSYKDCAGPKSITSTFDINLYAHIAVAKQGNVVTLYQYTPATNVLDKCYATVNSNEIFTSSYADLFFANTAPVGFLKDYFSGYVYDYSYFNVGLSPTQVMAVISGLHAELVLVSTGAPGGQSGGIFVLPTGASYNAQVTVPTSASLNKNGIVMLRNTSPSDIILVDYATGTDGINWNKIANFDTLSSDFYLQDYTRYSPIVYLNGVRNLSGVSAITGAYCGTGRAFERDYQISGLNRVLDAGKFAYGDRVVYDIPSRFTWQKLYSGGQSVDIGTCANSGISIYLNGQRCGSGIDYSTSGSILTMNSPLISGDLIAMDVYAPGYEAIGEIYTTGYFYTSGAFAQNSSRVYLNGQRMGVGVDYLEVVSGSPLQGPPIDKPTNTVVVIDSMDLWNI